VIGARLVLLIMAEDRHRRLPPRPEVRRDFVANIEPRAEDPGRRGRSLLAEALESGRRRPGAQVRRFAKPAWAAEATRLVDSSRASHHRVSPGSSPEDILTKVGPVSISTKWWASQSTIEAHVVRRCARASTLARSAATKHVSGDARTTRSSDPGGRQPHRQRRSQYSLRRLARRSRRATTTTASSSSRCPTRASAYPQKADPERVFETVLPRRSRRGHARTGGTGLGLSASSSTPPRTSRWRGAAVVPSWARLYVHDPASSDRC
jgi:hypothetical protein